MDSKNRNAVEETGKEEHWTDRLAPEVKANMHLLPEWVKKLFWLENLLCSPVVLPYVVDAVVRYELDRDTWKAPYRKFIIYLCLACIPFYFLGDIIIIAALLPLWFLGWIIRLVKVATRVYDDYKDENER